MEKRKIIYVGGSGKPYEVLKPRTDREGFHEYGERKSLKGLCDFLLENKKSEEFIIETTDAIANQAGEYIRKQEEKQAKYLSKKGLEGKII